MNNLIQVKLDVKYGIERVYPANELAHKLTELTGRTTFSEKDLELLKSMGYKFELMYNKSKFKELFCS